MPSLKRLLFIFGTRPEIVKLAPVIHHARNVPSLLVSIMHTGQHKEMADEMLRIFNITPDFNLAVMQHNQNLFSVSGKILEGLSRVLSREKFDLIICQGDTTSVFLGALAGYYTKTPVAHVEAGLRTKDKFSPYPEEINRRLTSTLADLHFTPTECAKNNLLREGVSESNIFVTGNTVIDALLWALNLPYRPSTEIRKLFSPQQPLILVTTHRRESFGEPHRRIFRALKKIVERHENVNMLFPVHPNPNVRAETGELLGNHPRIHLCSPLGYLDFIHAMKNSFLILSDSGGVQEEAPTLKKPVLVLREQTERPEGLESGSLLLVGTDEDKILFETERLLSDQNAYNEMIKNPNPFGDGQSAKRIVDRITSYLT